MHPLMLIGLLPDSRQVSREAAARHAVLTARRAGDDRPRPRSRAWLRLLPS